MTVNKERIRLWVDALRSGEFQQTTGALQRTLPTEESPVGFCCLGVACQVAVDNGVDVPKYARNGAVVYDDSRSFLPDRIRAWYGLEFFNPIVAIDDVPEPWMPHSRPLTTLNDEEKLSFPQIADAIERTFLTDVEAS